MPDSTSIPNWKSVTPNRKDDLSIERSIKTLDRQTQLATDATLSVLSTIETNITNITNGTTTVSAKWSSYTGLLIPWGLLALCLQA